MSRPDTPLLNILYSNSPLGIDYQAVNELEYLVDEGLINIKSQKLCKIDRLYEVIDSISNGTIKSIDYQGGGIKHMGLKVLGQELLLSFGMKSNIESLFNNRYPDLISKDLSTIIECGDTDPNKILDYFDLGVSRIIIIPYPDSEDILYYEFRFKDLSEIQTYIKNKKIYYADKIKQIINRR